MVDVDSFGGRGPKRRLSERHAGSKALFSGGTDPFVTLSHSLREAHSSLVLTAQNNEHVRRIKDNLDPLRREATAKLQGIKLQLGTGGASLKHLGSNAVAGPTLPGQQQHGKQQWGHQKQVQQQQQQQQEDGMMHAAGYYPRSLSSPSLQSLSRQLLRTQQHQQQQQIEELQQQQQQGRPSRGALRAEGPLLPGEAGLLPQLSGLRHSASAAALHEQVSVLSVCVDGS